VEKISNVKHEGNGLEPCYGTYLQGISCLSCIDVDNCMEEKRKLDFENRREG